MEPTEAHSQTPRPPRPKLPTLGCRSLRGRTGAAQSAFRLRKEVLPHAWTEEYGRNVTKSPCSYGRAQVAPKRAEGSLAPGSWRLPLAKEVREGSRFCCFSAALGCPRAPSNKTFLSSATQSHLHTDCPFPPRAPGRFGRGPPTPPSLGTLAPHPTFALGRGLHPISPRSREVQHPRLRLPRLGSKLWAVPPLTRCLLTR